MVKSSGNRLIYFLFGITVGLLVGVAFFIFKIDEYLSRMELFNQKASDTLVVEDQGGKVQMQKGGMKNNRDRGPSTTSKDSSSVIPQNTDSFFADSLYSGVTYAKDETIEVKKDELVEVREMEIQGETGGKNTKDSILQQISGIRDDKNPGTKLSVEYWLSPINYRGYKMTRSKLVLFGMNAGESSTLMRVDNVLYLKQGEHWYRLEGSADFRPLDKVSPPEQGK